jgi:hypothetical protein
MNVKKLGRMSGDGDNAFFVAHISLMIFSTFCIIGTCSLPFAEEGKSGR